MKNIFKFLIILMAGLTACINDLDVVPLDPDEQTTATLYDDPNAYKQVLAKIYAGLALTGQQGPAGAPDIAGIDEGFSSYIRNYFNHQELPTEEAVIAWNDQTIKDFHEMDWGAGDIFIQGMYSRIFYQITLANEFIRETSDSKLDSRGVSGTNRDEVVMYRNEARFLRALSYWHALDLFRNVPFVTDENAIGAFLPEQATPEQLFNYIESELLDLETKMVAARQNQYGRADVAAAWTLLAKLYLNAEVYTGQAKYTESITYSKKVIDAGYQLEPNYETLFLADNHNTSEIIFLVPFDGLNMQTYGGTNYIVHAAVGGSMSPGAFGIDGGWGGLRTTSELVSKFPDVTGDVDERAMFHTAGQSLAIDDIGDFTHGYAVTKYKNITRTGAAGKNLSFADIDFPMFRLGDVYLMYAEAVLRGGAGGDRATALSYVNLLRERAYGNSTGIINDSQLTLNFIIDERARELYWEAHRRTDLIRFGMFTTDAYLWPWKGGVKDGTAVSSKYQIYPIPSSDLAANPNLEQNTGY